MAEHLCTTCGQSLAAEPRACFCPAPPPPDTLRLVVERQQQRRAEEQARNIERTTRALAPLLSYAELGLTLPKGLQRDIEALCNNVYRAFYPARSKGGRPADLEKQAFHQHYWDAYHKVLLGYIKAGKGRPKKGEVAGEMLFEPRTFRRNRQKYGLPWPPPPP